MILHLPQKPALVDENRPSLVDFSTTVSIEEIRNSKAVASVVDKLYGVRHSLTEVMRESHIFFEEAQRDQKILRSR